MPELLFLLVVVVLGVVAVPRLRKAFGPEGVGPAPEPLVNDDQLRAVPRHVRIAAQVLGSSVSDPVDALARQGIERSAAARLFAFVPIAYFHVFARTRYGTPSDDAYTLRSDDGKSTPRSLAGEPEYAAAATLALGDATRAPARLESVARRSAEYDAFSKLVRSGSRPEDIRFGQLLIFERSLR